MASFKGFFDLHTLVHKGIRLTLLALLLPLMLQGCDEESLNLSGEQSQAQITAEFQTGSASSSPADHNQASATQKALSQTAAQSLPTRSAVGALIEDDQCSELKVTPPRGLACLHCTHDNARHQSRLLASLLFRSCLKNVAINYLIDGTFGFNEALLQEHIDLLSSGGRRVFLYFYLSNGATQRRYRSTLIDSFATTIAPEEFRSRINYDHELRFRYQEIITRLIPVLRYADSRGAIIHLLPSLEDNLDNQTFSVLAELLIETLPGDLSYAIGRSACPGCFEGNEDGVPGGFFSELHTINPAFTLRDGVVTNDGRTYSFEAQAGLPDLNDMEVLRDRAAELNNTFILWSAARQGLPPQTNAPYQHPDERIFEMPSVEERFALLRFLKGDR